MLVLKMLPKRAESIPSNVSGSSMYCSAALLTRISNLPSSSTVFCTASAQNFSPLISPGSNKHFLPCASTNSLVFLASSCSLRYTMATSAPSLAYNTDTERPIPLSPPVTSATLPFNLSLPL